MATLTRTFATANNVCTPVVNPEDARCDAIKFGASLTVRAGQTYGIKTSDLLAYPQNSAATDGTQTFKGISMYSFKTDSSGKAYLVSGSDSAAFDVQTMPMTTVPGWVSGTFDPEDLITGAGSGTAGVEVSTYTPASPTTGDIYSLYLPSGTVISFTIAGTQTATAAGDGLRLAWADNPEAAALATASGTATFILTGLTAGQALNVTSDVVGTGTFAKVLTTPAVDAARAQVTTITPASTIEVGDIFTLTLTNKDLTTTAVTYTATGTTVGSVALGMVAAWNANARAAAVATATGTVTVILTSTNPGSTFTVAAATTESDGTTSDAQTFVAVATTAAAGRSIADILTGAPGARVLHNGYWLIP